MKFGHEYEQQLTSQGFPEQWLGSAIDYKYLKKCIKRVHRELEEIGLDPQTLDHLTAWDGESNLTTASHTDKHEFFSAAEPHLSPITEEFCPQLRVLVDGKTGAPLDATLTPETKAALKRLARAEMITASRREHLGDRLHVPDNHQQTNDGESIKSRQNSTVEPIPEDAKWVQLPLTSAKNFFDLLEPKLQELDALRDVETRKLEDEILDLGDAVENVIEPVREGFEAKRDVSYRDLYFWREMFRSYMEQPIFYSDTEQNRGALTFPEAKKRLEAYDTQLRTTGLLAKMKTPQARRAAKQFLDLNVDILQIMHFQEMNAQAMAKILKKFDKRTHLEGQLFLKSLRDKYPSLIPANPKRIGAGGFANSIARDMYAEIGSKVISIVPQIDDWDCPVCYSMAWRPVSLGCCNSRFCIRCVIKMQDEES
nr:putative ring finger protein c6b12.07c [Quercus suber]